MLEKRIVGISPWSNPNYSLMKEAGIEWLRVNIPFPYVDQLGGVYAPGFLRAVDEVKTLSQLGFKIMGTTPTPGMYCFDKALNRQMIWNPLIPDWAGDWDSASFYDTYEKSCEITANLTRKYVDMWQVANEMDIEPFRGAMTREQAARFMLAGGRGVKKGNPDARRGINPSAIRSHRGADGKWLFETIYSEKDHPFDYAGVDSYFGSWWVGGVQDMILWIDEIVEMTHMPVLYNEWGYSSLGGLPKPLIGGYKPGMNSVCDTKAWHNVWKKEHTVEEQGEYLKTALKILATYPNCLGGFLYCWGDSETCWHCGSPTCPAECGWGLVDNQGNPKASYHVFKETVAQYY